MTGREQLAAAAGLARRAVVHVGRRGAFLAFLALLDLIVGYSLIQPLPLGLPARAVYQPFTDVMPIAWWSVAWLGVGVLALVAALWTRARPATFALAALLKTGWSLGYVIGWREGLPLFIRGYQTGAIFAAFALVTLTISGWRENGQ